MLTRRIFHKHVQLNSVVEWEVANIWLLADEVVLQKITEMSNQQPERCWARLDQETMQNSTTPSFHFYIQTRESSTLCVGF